MKLITTPLITILLVSATLRAMPPDWSISTGHQNAMVVYATVMDSSGNEISNAKSRLSASEYGVLAGSTPISSGPKGSLFQLKVGSDNWESDLTYSLYDGKTDRVVEIGPGPGFVAGSIVGTIVAPVVLKVKR